MILNPVWPLQLNKKIFSSVTLLLSTFQSLQEIFITDEAMEKYVRQFLTIYKKMFSITVFKSNFVGGLKVFLIKK